MAINRSEVFDDSRLTALESLTSETFSLWDERRVGFSWRHYYMNHTLRVRANALSIGAAEGADTDVVAYAATLHDITKRFDGPYKVDENGKRAVNQDGLWVNEPVQPARSNEVTRLYHEMNLYFQVHHDSGARIAENLLLKDRFSQDFAKQVAHVIRGHLRPFNTPWVLGSADDPYGDPESCSLFDADTIDANLGAVAFYRFVQIHGHRTIQENGGFDVVPFIDSMANWVERKREFIDSRLTKTGKEVAAARYESDRKIHAWLERERESEKSMKLNKEFGLIGLLDFFLEHADDPNMHQELDQVDSVWLPERRRRIADGEAPAEAQESVERVERFVGMLRAEMEGRIGGPAS